VKVPEVKIPEGKAPPVAASPTSQITLRSVNVAEKLWRSVDEKGKTDLLNH
jgi:hypothetical protein